MSTAHWIKIRADLDTDPRVFTMADLLRATAGLYVLAAPAKDLFGSVTDAVTRNVMRDVTVAGLSRVWVAANRHTTDGVFQKATLDYLDTLAQVPGFGEAMEAVGYAEYDPETRTVTLPRFTEYNAPDKNGHRGKSKAAERQQRYRERLKSPSESPIPDSPSPLTHHASRITHPPESDVTRDVTSDATPSVSVSISDSESVQRRVTLDVHKSRINTLRPAWTKMPAWSAEEEAALFAARDNLDALDEKDWLMLVNYMKWANSTANQGKDSHKVTSRRHLFLSELPSYLDRATAHWKQSGCPKLGAQPPRPKAPPPPPEPALPPAQNAAAFAGMLKDYGVKTPPKDATKPAAA